MVSPVHGTTTWNPANGICSLTLKWSTAALAGSAAARLAMPAAANAMGGRRMCRTSGDRDSEQASVDPEGPARKARGASGARAVGHADHELLAGVRVRHARD